MRKMFIVVMAVFSIMAFCLLLQAQEEKEKREPGTDPSQAEENGEKEEQAEPQEELSKLDKLIRDLLSDSYEEKNIAEKELADMGEEAVPELNKILGVNIVVKQPDIPDELKEKIKTLIKELDSEEWTKREAATKELEKIGKAAEIYLRRVSEYGTPEAKTRAEKLLDKLDEDKRGGKTEEELEQKMFWAKLSAIRILGKINSDSCNKGFLAALADTDRMVSTLALLHLRQKSGWSLGFSPLDIEKKRRSVVEKWTEYLEKPEKPLGGEKYSLEGKLEAGETLKTSVAWNMHSVNTTKTTTSSVVVGRVQPGQPGQQQKQTKQNVSEQTYITEIMQQQNYTDKIEKIEKGLLQFTRKYQTHRSGSNYKSKRAGAIVIGNAPRMVDSNLTGAELEFTYRPGFCDVKTLKGNVNLNTRNWLASNGTDTGILLPGKPVGPGDSWIVPELSAFKLLSAIAPQGTNVFNLSSIKLDCRFLEVIEEGENKKARISITASFGPEETAVNNAGGIRMISMSSSYGRSVSLANATLMGNCIVDLDSGTVTNFNLFGTIHKMPAPDTRFSNRKQEQKSVGHLELNVTTGKKK